MNPVTQEHAAGMDDMAEFAVCNGPCRRIDVACPCPEACHIPAGRAREIGPVRLWLINHQPPLTVVAAVLAVLLLVIFGKLAP